jgi:hypothetical protein
MIDASDRIVKINEVISSLFEAPEIPPSLNGIHAFKSSEGVTMKMNRLNAINDTISHLLESSFVERRAERARKRAEADKASLEAMQAREALRQENLANRNAKRDERKNEFIGNWKDRYSDNELKGFGVDPSSLPTDEYKRSQEMLRIWRKQLGTKIEAGKKQFDAEYKGGYGLGGAAKAERAKVVGRELGLDGSASQEQVDAYTKQQRDAMNQARARDRDPAAKAAYQDAQKAKKIADWEASQKAKMLGRIGARSQTGAEYVAAEGQARAAEKNLADVMANQKSEAQIRSETRAKRDALEKEIRATNPYGYGEAPITTPSDYIKNLPGMYKSKRQPKPASPQSTTASTGQYKMYNRQTGQIEMSDSPGVDRVFTDSKGDYRVEGGSGKRIYV